eukprot:Hpha_TRINITY_DN15956_c0_g1::TRINITY_DN15956_c0_g1_i1::g.75336::m.75336
MSRPPTALLALGALTQVAGNCLTITPGASGTGCTALSSCSDSGILGDCKTSVVAGFYCYDFSDYGTQCEACTCKDGCETDGGDGTPQQWRPGHSNPYGDTPSSANGIRALSTAQKNALVAQHNFVRAYHGACPLQWSDAIEQNVIDSANAGWITCTSSHSANTRADTSPGGFTSLGENLASQSSMYYSENFPTDLKTMAWYLEEYDWDYATSATKAGGGATGHFTQVVWKSTTHVGCQMYQCDYSFGKKVLLACQ